MHRSSFSDDRSRWDERPSARSQESSSSSSSPRPRSRDLARKRTVSDGKVKSKSKTSTSTSTSSKSKTNGSSSSKSKTKSESESRSTSGIINATTSSTTSATSGPVAADDSNSFSVSPSSVFNNLQTAFSAFQSIPGLSAATATAFHPNTSFELAIPETPVTNLLNPKYLHLPSSHAVLQNRLATNLPRHGSSYLILVVGTLLATHWLVLAALFSVVKFGFFIQSYNGRDIARDLGVRQYASSQGIMSGFAAAAALVALWAFSSLFGVVLTLVKVGCLVLLHAAFLDSDGAAQQQQRPQPGSRVASGQLSGPPPPHAVPAQGVLRPAGTALTPGDAAAWAGQQLRSASEGHLAAYSNGWYVGEGYTPGAEGDRGARDRDEFALMPRTPRSFDDYPPAPGPRREEHGVVDVGGPWGESARPQSYAGGRAY